MQIAANGIVLECKLHGPENGPPLVLIQGLGSQLIQWCDEIVEGFAAAGFRVITFDNRDVGLSQRLPAPGVSGRPEEVIKALSNERPLAAAYSLSDMADDVVGLLDSLGHGKAHVFGISMGGAITQRLMLDHADRLLSATIVMSSARLRGRDIARQLVVYPAGRAAFIEQAVLGDREWGSPGFRAPEDYIRNKAGRVWDRGFDAEGVNRQLLAILAAEDRVAALGAIDLPCLVIHGAQDTLIPPEDGRHVAEQIPGAELEIIEGMGHTIPPSLATYVVARVDQFARKCAPL